MPFISVKGQESSWSLFEAVGNLLSIFSNSPWYYFISILCLPILLIQPFLLFISAVFVYFSIKNHTQSIIVNSFIDDIKEDRSNSYFSYIIAFFAFYWATYLGIALFLTLWFIVYIAQIIISAPTDIVTPNFAFLLSIIVVFYQIINLKYEVERKFNSKVFLKLIQDTLQETFKDEVKKTNLYKEFKEIGDLLRDNMNQMTELIMELKKVVTYMDIKDKYLIQKFNFLEQVFEQMFLPINFLFGKTKKGTIVQFPVRFLDKSKNNSQVLVIENSAIDKNIILKKTYFVEKQNLENLKVELFSTSKWLVDFPNYIDNAKEVSFSINPSLIKSIQAGDFINDSLYVIQTTDDEKIVTQKIPANLYINPNPSKIKYKAIIASIATLFGYYFWVASEFPLFLINKKGLVLNHNVLAGSSILLLYLGGIAIAYYGIKDYLKSRPLGYFKSFLTGFLLSFAVTGAITVIKTKYCFFVEDLNTVKVSTKDLANIREEPDKNSRVVRQVKNNDELKIESQSGDWYKVYHGEYFIFEGYIHKSLIKIDSTQISK